MVYSGRNVLTIWPIGSACGLRKLLTGSDITEDSLLKPRIVLQQTA